MELVLAALAGTLIVALVVAVIVLSRRLAGVPERTRDESQPQQGDDSDEALSSEIVERMSEGVVVLNDSLTLVAANPAARSLLAIPPDPLPARLRSDELLSRVREAIATDAVVESELTLWPEQTRVQVRAVPLPRGGAAAFIRDITQEQHAHHVRRQFVMNASHELKTPAAGLLALAEAAAHAAVDDPANVERLTQRVSDEARRVTHLIQDLLDLSRLEDPSSISSEEVFLDEVVERELKAMHDAARERGVTFAANVAAGVRVRGDERQLGLMTKNLLDNAIRYTPEGGTVSVTLENSDLSAVLRVADTGIGIPLRAQARVFERFYRVDEDRARNTGGTGLGLSIVKHVVELHRGHVGLESVLGEGSTFTVTLPAAEPS